MPIWVPVPAVVVIHDRQIARHGGASGLRDMTLLEAACARPLHRADYEDAKLPVLAAAYAFGIAKAHAFVDGNKRTAFVTMATFLGLNGLWFRAPAGDVVRMMEGLAAGDVSEPAFAEWVAGGSESASP